MMVDYIKKNDDSFFWSFGGRGLGEDRSPHPLHVKVQPWAPPLELLWVDKEEMMIELVNYYFLVVNYSIIFFLGHN